MSYDLTTRKDETFSEIKKRTDIHAIISSIPSVEPNGSGGFVLKCGNEIYMEIDVELVSEEGDNIEEDLSHPAPDANCVNFHIPYGFIDGSDRCLPVAKQIAGNLKWELYDPQCGHLLQDSSGQTPKPWWKFW